MTMTEAERAERAIEGDGGRQVRLRIPAKAEYVTLGRLALTGLAQLRAMDDATVADLKLALTEAVSNSVRHAYGDGSDGHVDISYRLHPDRLEVEVVDDGAGFDVDAPPPVDDEELSEGGLGIAIIRTIADELEIVSSPGVRGSRLRFVKLLH
ncbi:MAG TPA: ATP-binding protein [Gaiellaceae bacterium]|nr:ATP-binding protein [Gaiellaceae bacterium]